jgi:hypothetical protein
VAAGAIVVWAVLIGLILLGVFPYKPRTTRGWTVLLVCGPPAYLAVSWLGERVTGPRAQHLAPKRFSVRWFGMMAFAVVLGSALLAFSVWTSLWFGR